jgi:hypothetical protein
MFWLYKTQKKSFTIEVWASKGIVWSWIESWSFKRNNIGLIQIQTWAQILGLLWISTFRPMPLVLLLLSARLSPPPLFPPPLLAPSLSLLGFQIQNTPQVHFDGPFSMNPSLFLPLFTFEVTSHIHFPEEWWMSKTQRHIFCVIIITTSIVKKFFFIQSQFWCMEAHHFPPTSEAYKKIISSIHKIIQALWSF